MHSKRQLVDEDEEATWQVSSLFLIAFQVKEVAFCIVTIVCLSREKRVMRVSKKLSIDVREALWL